MKTPWETVGMIGVDAGLCWLGDPCYILHTKTAPKDIGKNWRDLCDKMSDGTVTGGLDYRQFNYDTGHAGLGVVVQTGYGDGFYPVQIKRNAEGRIKEVRVKFD